MERGHTLPELALVIVVTGGMCAIALPRLSAWLDRAAVEQASADLVMAITLARDRAAALGSSTRVQIGADTIVVDTLGRGGWGRWSTRPGPARDGVSVTASNHRIVFSPSGIAHGLSNSRIVVGRGLHHETITVSRLGRVKR
jgi:Tfp pilus assembly protein FimT